MTSTSAWDCPRTESTARVTQSARLNVGTMTETRLGLTECDASPHACIGNPHVDLVPSDSRSQGVDEAGAGGAKAEGPLPRRSEGRVVLRSIHRSMRGHGRAKKPGLT